MQSLLREYARNHVGGLPFGIVVRITSAICEALHDAYFEPGPDGAPRRIVHECVGPANVIVGYDGSVSLVAGSAHATPDESKSGYMSPEQIKSQPLDHRADIFSLGTLLWEMLVGKRLFKRDTDMQMLYAILEESIPPPSVRNDKLPPAVDRVVMRALARAREDRYADALELARDVQAIAKDTDGGTDASTLARFVRDLLPEEPASIATPERRDAPPRADTAPPASSGSGMVIAILVLVLISSIGFWIAIAPNL